MSNTTWPTVRPLAIREVWLWILPVALLFLLSACATGPEQREGVPAASGPSAAADVALSLVGVPYRYGGASPRGMDCSGLVQYSYRQVGIRVPRTVADQRRHSFPVSMDRLQAGDLLFFRLGGRVSHVGIYLGRRRFVHAPSTGKRVSVTTLDNIYWRRRLVGAGRFY
ncbi:MAG TPA: NlpC/P60 family protein [Gammaproteobacteria bacterium]|nr:NlpC/P60 family protein [Gammaproteobacteria bacterium]